MTRRRGLRTTKRRDMLTEETLRESEALAGLTDEQLKAVAALSRNDEEAVIGRRLGEVYRQMDTTIEEATGVKRDGDEKTYVYLKRAASDVAARLKEAEEKAAAPKAAAEEKENPLHAELAAAKKKYKELKDAFDKAEAAHAAELLGVRVDGEFERAAAGLKISGALPKEVADLVRRQAVAAVKSAYTPKVSEDGRVVFVGEDGAVKCDAANPFEPVGAAWLLKEEYRRLKVLDEPRRQPGGGTLPKGGSPAVSYRTQVEAQEAISKELLSKGLARGGNEYQSEFNKLWKESGAQSLPLQ